MRRSGEKGRHSGLPLRSLHTKRHVVGQCLGQAALVFGAGDFDGAEALQVRGGELYVEEREATFVQARDEMLSPAKSPARDTP